MLEWYVRHAYLSSSGCQLLSQGFQFLLLNKQLLTISLSQRLQGKNPLKTLQATHKNKQGTVGIFWTGNSKKTKQKPSIRQRGQALVHLQQLAFVRAGRSDVPFGHFINLSPEVSVLLLESLHLCLRLWDRGAGFEAQPGNKVLFSTFRGHGFFTGVTQNSTEKRTLHQGNLSTMWMDTENLTEASRLLKHLYKISTHLVYTTQYCKAAIWVKKILICLDKYPSISVIMVNLPIRSRKKC